MYRQACASLLRAGRSLACEAATSSQSCVVAQAAACTSTTLRPGPWYTAARTVMAAVHSSAPAAGTLGQARWYSSAASLSTLSPGHRKRRKRRARGGGDKQAGRGRDGQKSRSGARASLGSVTTPYLPDRDGTPDHPSLYCAQVRASRRSFSRAARRHFGSGCPSEASITASRTSTTTCSSRSSTRTCAWASSIRGTSSR